MLLYTRLTFYDEFFVFWPRFSHRFRLIVHLLDLDRVVDPDWLEFGSGSSILAQSGSGSEPSQKGTLNNKFCKIEFKVKKNWKAVLTMQELKPYGATSSGGAGAVKQCGSDSSCFELMFNIIKTFQNGVAGLFFPVLWSRSRIILVEPKPQWVAAPASKFLYPEPHQNDAAPQHLFFLNLSIFNIRFGAGAASLYGYGCS
jgi:hypothetical protein